MKNVPFQVWEIEVKEDKTALLRVEDGDENQLTQFELDFTTFPIPKFDLWLIEQTLLLPSEY